MRFIVNLDRDETGMIVAECPAIPGCITQAQAENEALANIREAIELCLEARAANGMPLTVATCEVEDHVWRRRRLSCGGSDHGVLDLRRVRKM